jgi:hypothetical protein
MYIAPDAKLDDGRFDVVMGSESTKWAFLRDIRKVFDGSHSKLPYVQTVRGATVEISSDRPFDIYADGDPIGRTPATVSISPRSLKDLGPAGVCCSAPPWHSRARPAPQRAVPVAAARRPPAGCCCGSSPTRSRACRASWTAVRCSSPPPTARRPRRR